MAIDCNSEKTMFTVYTFKVESTALLFIFDCDIHGGNCTLLVSDRQVLLHGLYVLEIVLPCGSQEPSALLTSLINRGQAH